LFEVDDNVHVVSLGKGVVREVRNGGRYLVEIKGRAMVVHATQLRLVEERKPRTRAIAPQSAGSIPEDLVRGHASASVDLHGMAVDEALAAVESFLSDAILAGHAEVRVIHGRSGGRLRAAVHGRLKLLPSVRGFHLDPANAGVTIVRL
jgi:DNA mismatch repair protein MutS2